MYHVVEVIFSPTSYAQNLVLRSVSVLSKVALQRALVVMAPDIRTTQKILAKGISCTIFLAANR